MRFFVLKYKPGTVFGETEFITSEPSNVGEALTCEACGRFISMLTWLPPYRVELELWDKCFGDIARGSGNNIIISERFRSLWKEQKLIGLEGFDPVEVVRIKRHKRFKGDPLQYYRVSVVRSKAIIDQKASGFEWEEEPTCQECRSGNIIKRWKRIVLEPNTWSGENIFIARGLSGTYITDERFKEFSEEFKIINCNLIPAEEYARDFYPGQD